MISYQPLRGPATSTKRKNHRLLPTALSSTIAQQYGQRRPAPCVVARRLTLLSSFPVVTSTSGGRGCKCHAYPIRFTSAAATFASCGRCCNRNMTLCIQQYFSLKPQSYGQRRPAPCIVARRLTLPSPFPAVTSTSVGRGCKCSAYPIRFPSAVVATFTSSCGRCCNRHIYSTTFPSQTSKRFDKPLSSIYMNTEKRR